MTTRTQKTDRSRWVLDFLAAIVAVLATIFGAASASATTPGAAENRVRASTVVIGVDVEPPRQESPGQRLGNDAAGPEIAVATGVAAKTADEIPGLASAYRDITKRNSIRNVATDVAPQQFGDNLITNGWKVTTSPSGRGATIYTKDGATYSVYGQSASTGGPTVQFIPRGTTSPTLKIRLGD